MAISRPPPIRGPSRGFADQGPQSCGMIGGVSTLPPAPVRPSPRGWLAVGRAPMPFEASMRALCAMGGPMLVGALFDHLAAGGIAALGTLATPFIGKWTYGQRLVRLSLHAGSCAVAYAVGVLAAGSGLGQVLVVAVFAGLVVGASRLFGAWSERFAMITANVCIISTGMNAVKIADGEPTRVSESWLVLAGGLWVCVVHLVGTSRGVGATESQLVRDAYRLTADYLAFIGTASGAAADIDAARIRARQAVLAGWDALGPETPEPDRAPQRARLYVMLQCAQRILEGGTAYQFRGAGAIPDDLVATTAAIGLAVEHPELARVLRVPPLPEHGSAALASLRALVDRAQRAAVDPGDVGDIGPTPLWESFRDRVEGMRPVGAVQARVAARLAITIAAAELLGLLLGSEHGYWVALTVLFVLQADPAATHVRAVQRAGGTVIGVLLAGLLAVGGMHPGVVALSACVVGYLLPIATVRSYVAVTALFTVYAVLLIEAGTPTAETLPVLVERLLMTGLGCVLAVAAIWLVWPLAATRRMPGAVADSLRATSSALRGSVAPDSASGLEVVRTTTIPAVTRRRLLLQLLTLRALFDRALGERRTAWPDMDAYWSLVVLTVRIGVLSVTRTRADDTGPLLTVSDAKAAASHLDAMALSLERGQPPPALPPAVSSSNQASSTPLVEMVLELHAAATVCARRSGSPSESS